MEDDDDGIGMEDGMVMGIGLNEEYSVVWFDFEFDLDLDLVVGFVVLELDTAATAAAAAFGVILVFRVELGPA